MPLFNLGRSRVRESRSLGSVGAKAEWLSYPTNPQHDSDEQWESDAPGREQMEANRPCRDAHQ